MRSKIFRIVAGMVSVLLLAGTPIQADPVTMNDILQIVDGYQSPAQLNLRSLPQAGKPISENGTSLLAGVEVSSDEPQTSVQTIQGDVDVTICDCGEILVAGGGFPKWPLLFLAGIPLFFPHGHDTIPPLTPPIHSDSQRCAITPDSRTRALFPLVVRLWTYGFRSSLAQAICGNENGSAS